MLTKRDRERYDAILRDPSYDPEIRAHIRSLLWQDDLVTKALSDPELLAIYTAYHQGQSNYHTWISRSATKAAPHLDALAAVGYDSRSDRRTRRQLEADAAGYHAVFGAPPPDAPTPPSAAASSAPARSHTWREWEPHPRGLPIKSDIVLEDAVPGSNLSVFGVVFGGLDQTGDYFHAGTDFGLNRSVDGMSVFLDHSLGDNRDRIGQVVSVRKSTGGLLFDLAIDQRWHAHVKDMLSRGKLGVSTGAVGQTAIKTLMTDGRKRIDRWELAELSLTENPQEPRTLELNREAAMIEAWQLALEQRERQMLKLS